MWSRLALKVGLLSAVLAQEERTKGRWHYLRSEKVIVWHTTEQAKLAEQVLAWAEETLQELVRALDYQPEVIFTVRLHPTPLAWAQQPTWKPKGTLSPTPTLVEVYPAATRRDLAAMVRSHLCGAFLEHLYFSEGLRLQNRSLLYMPDWFLWGFAYFWGEGWTVEDIARLQGLSDGTFRALMAPESAPSPLRKSLYKSLWFYLYRTYGQRKVLDLLYMTRLTRDIREAMEIILGLEEAALGEKWRAFLRELPGGKAGRDLVELVEQPLLAATVAPSGSEYAYATLDKGRIRYFLEAEEEIYELPGSWAWRSSYLEPEVPLAFSAEGDLAWLSYTLQGPVLWVKPKAKGPARPYLLPVVAVHSFSWMGSQALLLSALDREAKVRLYRFGLPSGPLSLIGEAQGDLIFPYEAGGAYWAAWQPDTNQTARLSLVWEPFRPVHRPPSGQTWDFLPFLPFYGVVGGWLITDTLRLALVDVCGWGVPWHFSRDTSFSVGLTDFPGLWRWAGSTGGKAYALYYRNGRLRLGALSLEGLRQSRTVFPSFQVAEAIQYRLQRRNTRLPETKPPPPVSPEPPSDTSRSYQALFYLFDEDIGRPARQRRQVPKPPAPASSAPSTPVSGLVPYHWLLWDLRMAPTLHPLMRLGWEIELIARDWQGAHEWRFRWVPYINLRSAELQLSYRHHKGRWQPMVELYRQSHFFSPQQYGRAVRHITWHGEVGLAYVFAPHWRTEGSLNLLLAQRYDIEGLRSSGQLNEAAWVGPRVQVRHARLSWREHLPWRGWELTLRGEIYYSRGRWDFPLLMAQAYHHQPLFQRGVLRLGATALWGGLRGRPLLLGGVPDWVNYDFLNRTQIPFLGTPGTYYLMPYFYLPGFPYHARRGRNLILGQAVLRLPLLAWREQPFLPTRSLYGFEWHLSYHVGTTWTTGNPFSQRNPIDAEYIYRPPLVISVQALKTPFLMSFGTGVLFRIMRLPIHLGVYWPVEEAMVGRPLFIARLGGDLVF
ncbi:MAG: hypothetical protein NZ958_08095 [Bacteroidia bacterium]|nr:hypothetical protein [Bacteroidia bacterium]MDW8088558.1 hypothetical protein [Bacteroidia bacterium]